MQFSKHIPFYFTVHTKQLSGLSLKSIRYQPLCNVAINSWRLGDARGGFGPTLLGVTLLTELSHCVTALLERSQPSRGFVLRTTVPREPCFLRVTFFPAVLMMAANADGAP